MRNVGIGINNPKTKLDVAGSIINRNSTEGFAQRISKVQGAVGTFNHIRIITTFGGAGSYAYNIQIACAPGPNSAFQIG